MNLKNSINRLLNEEFKKRKEQSSKYTITQFSRDLGIQKDSMIAYINGNRVPNADSLIRIAKGLNVSIDYLCGLSDVKKPMNDCDSKTSLSISENMERLTQVSQKIEELQRTPVNLIDTRTLEIISDITRVYFSLKKIRDGEE